MDHKEAGVRIDDQEKAIFNPIFLSIAEAATTWRKFGKPINRFVFLLGGAILTSAIEVTRELLTVPIKPELIARDFVEGVYKWAEISLENPEDAGIITTGRLEFLHMDPVGPKQ
jgi:hypothetical protein